MSACEQSLQTTLAIGFHPANNGSAVFALCFANLLKCPFALLGHFKGDKTAKIMWACTFSISGSNLFGSCGSKNLDSLGHKNLQIISSDLCETEMKSI